MASVRFSNKHKVLGSIVHPSESFDDGINISEMREEKLKHSSQHHH